MNSANDLTEGKVLPLILKFYFPLLCTNMLQQIYSFADTLIVGRGIGDDALAAVGNMSSLTFFVLGLAVGLFIGFAVPIAQSYGAKDFQKLRRTIAASVILAVGIIIFASVISVAFLPALLRVIKTDERIFNDCLTYGYIVFGGIFATVAYNLTAGILRALGNSKTPMIAILASTVLNIGLDCLFIMVFHTGVWGAAVATVIAQVVSALICLNRLRKITEIHLTRNDWKVPLSVFALLLKNGVPMSLMNSVTAVGSMVLQSFVNGLGVVYTTAFSACVRYMNMLLQPGATAGFAMSAFTSQNYGAGKYDRIREGLRCCVGFVLILSTGLGIVMVLFPVQLAGFMINGTQSISIAAQFLPVVGVFLFAVNLLFVFRNAVQGMGFPIIPMCSGALEMVLRISSVVLLIRPLGFVAMACAEASAWTGAFLMNAIAFFVIYRRESRASEKTLPVM